MIDPVAMLTRRRLLEFGGASGLTLGGLWRARAAAPAVATRAPIRACILVFYYGGPSHLDTYDLKPDAPAEIRGEFRSIATSAPGIRVCEHLPRMARVMHKVALVRSVTHAATLHDSASIHALTGRPLDGPDRELFSPLPQFYPEPRQRRRGAAAGRRRPRCRSRPCRSRSATSTRCRARAAGSSAPRSTRCGSSATRRAAGTRRRRCCRAEGVAPARLDGRRMLLAALERAPTGDPLRDRHEKAYKLLDSVAVQRAMEVEREPLRVRERYGFGPEAVATGEGGGGGNGAEMGYARHMRGQNLLLARRLVEAGVPFVNVYDFKQQGQNWDAHFKGANQHKTHLLPQADQSLSALIEDLDARGLLDTTLVVAMGEFGRTPKINGDGGRDHWPNCYTVLLAGGGVTGGAVYGASDRIGAFPAADPITPGDLAATIFWRFGIDPATEIIDRAGRPHRVASGEPIRRLFGG